MDESEVGHVSVLLDEVLGLLAPQPGEVVCDGTLGRGGHAAAMIPLMSGGTYLGMDLDGGNLNFARERLGPIAEAHGVRLIAVQGNFAGMRSAMDTHGIAGADGLLADLGFASNQMDNPARGLSFMGDGPLDMRLSPGTSPAPGSAAGSATASGNSPESAAGEWADGGYPRGTAAELVNTLPEQDLADVIYRFGEERLSRRIARKIVEKRAESPILTTGELAEICRRAYGPAAGKSKIHPATRTFQGLRIAVNGELDALDGLLRGMMGLLNPGGRAGIISFHSLEDRPVKQAFLKFQQDGQAERLTRKPLTAGPEELARNPRSRSAKLRGIRKTPPA
ncbi:16S rRNA (cytosine(1402)-N(4))-methyltransferase RsmH [Algisphaera agarilytica]|uniref:Ribosomal RNA small subunit methyltransferase H n=1 Tax=Algisphaera agarilytica TaxID=1385975 RepID=A0A7X0H8F3_9BACT|nr:16S rRNA (cytosine(1402)-N(4))-methyltransferase RsmH [Algisphaera agarilytica]MBB6431156.1 16S rRNA (cytosine1402-N4)-methyltransferase [Algisphaera agarilytica]